MTPPRSWKRRQFLTTASAGGAALALNSAFPRTGAAASAQGVVRSTLNLGSRLGDIDPIVIIDHTEVRALARQALDAATAAGATYADVRLTRVLTQEFAQASQNANKFAGESEQFGIGIRARVAGGWGFAASPYWTPSDVLALARSAVAQAKVNAAANAAVGVDAAAAWSPIPVASGSWKTPGVVDPFVVSIEEKGDLMQSWAARAERFRWPNSMDFEVGFVREERALATTDGTYCTQTLYRSGGFFRFYGRKPDITLPLGTADASGLTLAGGGWELCTEANIPAQMPALYDQACAPQPPLKSADIGRYDVVCDGATTAALLAATIGTATQLDRALGFEANAGGTSYLGPDPLALLGVAQIASPLATITANRSMPRGLATVKWDDEGVEPQPFTLVKNGVLVDYQTTREQAPWLGSYYRARGTPVVSHGCAGAMDALCTTTQHTPNLVMEPGGHDVSFQQLVSDTARGFAIKNGGASVDFQQRNGVGNGAIYEIVNGRIGKQISNLVFMFNTIQLWKNLLAIGGKQSVVQSPASSTKGEPAQSVGFSVQAVPAKFAKVDFVYPVTRV